MNTSSAGAQIGFQGFVGSLGVTQGVTLISRNMNFELENIPFMYKSYPILENHIN